LTQECGPGAVASKIGPCTVRTMSASKAYLQIHERLTDLAEDLSEAEGSAMVPASPAWSVKDVYAHVVGAAKDILEGNIGDIGTDSWTAVHVDSRRSADLEAVCDEWSKIVPAFVDRIAATSDQPPLVAGTWTHEQDIRGAVGLQGVASGDGLDVALGKMDAAVDRLEAAGAPTLRIIVPGREWIVGQGDISATLSTTRYELARLIASRRSAAQIVALDWEGDPKPFVVPLTVYGPCEQPLSV